MEKRSSIVARQTEQGTNTHPSRTHFHDLLPKSLITTLQCCHSITSFQSHVITLYLHETEGQSSPNVVYLTHLLSP